MNIDTHNLTLIIRGFAWFNIALFLLTAIWCVFHNNTCKINPEYRLECLKRGVSDHKVVKTKLFMLMILGVIILFVIKP